MSDYLLPNNIIKTPNFTVTQSRYLKTGIFSIQHSNAVNWRELVDLADAIQALNCFPLYDDIVAWNETRLSPTPSPFPEALPHPVPPEDTGQD